MEAAEKAVEIADANAVITINGTIQAANEGSGTTANWAKSSSIKTSR